MCCSAYCRVPRQHPSQPSSVVQPQSPYAAAKPPAAPALQRCALGREIAQGAPVASGFGLFERTHNVCGRHASVALAWIAFRTQDRLVSEVVLHRRRR